MNEEKIKQFSIINSRALLAKYKRDGTTVTLHLRENKQIIGKINWLDSYAIKLSSEDKSGNIIVPIHNVLYYECEPILQEGEREKETAHRAEPAVTGEEKSQLNRYRKKKALLHFYLKNGIEIKGQLKEFQEYVYTVKPDDEDWIYRITKRHILYYKKVRL